MLWVLYYVTYFSHGPCEARNVDMVPHFFVRECFKFYLDPTVGSIFRPLKVFQWAKAAFNGRKNVLSPIER